MANKLVILESPNKIKAVKGYLGKNYKVIASVGHVRDLPKSTLGIDIEHDFTPKYINIRGKGDIIRDLKKEAKAADTVYLATDPDREGEAISWHLMQVLGLDSTKAKRIRFNEVTESAVKAAVKNPGQLDMNLVDAQQTRRILDRIVGYQLSPILWKKIKSGLSAGRVQSVATRLIVDRENEIRAFKAEEYWTIDAQLKTAAPERASRLPISPARATNLSSPTSKRLTRYWKRSPASRLPSRSLKNRSASRIPRRLSSPPRSSRRHTSVSASRPPRP